MDRFDDIKRQRVAMDSQFEEVTWSSGYIDWLITEVERLRRIEDVARSMKLRMNGGVVHIPRDDILRLDEVLADNPRPDTPS